MADPAKEMVDFLESNSELNLLTGINLLIGPVRDNPPSTPDDAVFVSVRGGRLPHRVMGLQSEVRYPLVFIRVRNRSYEAGYYLVRAIMNILMTAKITGYMDLEPMQSEPDFLDMDSKNRLMWDLTYLMKYEEVSA